MKGHRVLLALGCRERADWLRQEGLDGPRRAVEHSGPDQASSTP